jgi:hypothetical protein
MALAKQHGLIGYIIKQIGITYNEDGSVCNPPLPNLFTEQIIEYVKYAEAHGLKKIVITIPNPSDYFTKNQTPIETLLSSSYALFMQKLGKYAPESWQSDYSQKQYHFNSNRHYTGTIINPSKLEIAAATMTDMVLWDLTNPYRPVPTILPFDMAHESKPAFDSFAYNPTGSQIAISRYSTVKICDIETKTIISTKVPVQYANGISYALLFSHDGNKLIAYRNNGETGRFNIYDLTTQTWSYKTIARTIFTKLMRYNNSYVSFCANPNNMKQWNSDLEQLDNIITKCALSWFCDTDTYPEDNIRSTILSNKAIYDSPQTTSSNRPFLSADRIKLAKVVNKHNVPSHIVYTDTTPDIKQLTIDQLLAIKHQQKIVTND